MIYFVTISQLFYRSDIFMKEKEPIKDDNPSILPNPGDGQGIPEPDKPSEELGQRPIQKPMEPKGRLATSFPLEEKVVETLDPQVVEVIRNTTMGNPEEETILLELAKKDRGVRDFLKYGPLPLVVSSPDLTTFFLQHKKDMDEDASG